MLRHVPDSGMTTTCTLVALNSLMRASQLPQKASRRCSHVVSRAYVLELKPHVDVYLEEQDERPEGVDEGG